MNESNILAIILFVLIALNSKKLVKKMLSMNERNVKILCAIAFIVFLLVLGAKI